MKTFRLSIVALFASGILLWGGWQSIGTQSSSTASSSTSTRKAAAKAAPSAQEIADAKSKNLVWVNTNTRVYHMSSSSVYGTTKRGKFMSEDDAKKAGYRSASEPAAAKKHAAAGSAPK